MKCLTFGELKIGDTFISAPSEGDTPSAGLFVFVKRAEEQYLDSVRGNSAKLTNEVASDFPKSMLVVKVLI